MKTQLEESSFKHRIGSIGTTLKETLPFVNMGTVTQGPFNQAQRKRENLILSAIESTQRFDAIPADEQATHLMAALQEACRVIQFTKAQNRGEVQKKAVELENEIQEHLSLVKPFAHIHVA